MKRVAIFLGCMILLTGCQQKTTEQLENEKYQAEVKRTSEEVSKRINARGSSLEVVSEEILRIEFSTLDEASVHSVKNFENPTEEFLNEKDFTRYEFQKFKNDAIPIDENYKNAPDTPVSNSAPICTTYQMCKKESFTGEQKTTYVKKTSERLIIFRELYLFKADTKEELEAYKASSYNHVMIVYNEKSLYYMIYAGRSGILGSPTTEEISKNDKEEVKKIEFVKDVFKELNLPKS